MYNLQDFHGQFIAVAGGVLPSGDFFVYILYSYTEEDGFCGARLLLGHDWVRQRVPHQTILLPLFA